MFASDITPERKTELFEKLARKIVDLRVTPIAIITLESAKPLSFVGSQLMVFFQPIFSSVFPFRQYEEFAALLEERSNLEEFIRLIERMEDDRRVAQQAEKKAKQPAAAVAANSEKEVK
jgi:hypothetical protein